MADQIKFSFDSTTLQKIGKGILISATGAVALYILEWLGTIDFGSVFTPMIAALVPIIVNAVREWIKGTPKP